MEKVSVLMPSYNYEQFISEAIDSVLAQTYPNWELIVVDDDSQDGSVQRIQGYVEQFPDRIKLFFHERGLHKGLAESYRLALENSDGNYVAFLEADDLWAPESLEVRLKVLKDNEGVAVVYTDVEMFGDPREILERRRHFNKWKLPYNELSRRPFYAFDYLMDKNIVLTCSAFMTRRSLMNELTLSTPHDAWLDWWLLAQLSLRGPFFYIPEKKTRWRVHRQSYIHRYNQGRADLEGDSYQFRKEILSSMRSYFEERRENQDGPLLACLHRAIRNKEWQRAFLFLKHTLKKALPFFRKKGCVLAR